MSDKSQLRASTSALALLVTADDGGVGKTHFCIQVATAFRLAGQDLELFQLDSKSSLAQKTGLPVKTLAIADRAEARSDDMSAADIIAPWYRRITDPKAPSSLLEVGGATPPLFHAGIADLDLEEDIGILGLDLRAFVVMKAGEDSARQLIREVRRLETNLPGAKIIVVRNEMAGCPIQGADYLEDRIRKPLLAILKKYDSIRMPRLRTRSMALYERLHVTPDVVVSWHLDNYREAIQQLKRPRDEVKMLVKDVAAWSGIIQDEILRVLPELKESADG